jgi:signal transduction histidine kinase
MKSTIITWWIFCLCLFVSFSALAWVTVAVTELEKADKASREEAELEERIRLALWRMDSVASSMVSMIQWNNQDTAATPNALTQFVIDQNSQVYLTDNAVVNKLKQQVSAESVWQNYVKSNDANQSDGGNTSISPGILSSDPPIQQQNNKPNEQQTNQEENPINPINPKNWGNKYVTGSKRKQQGKALQEFNQRVKQQADSYGNNRQLEQAELQINGIVTPFLANDQLMLACSVGPKGQEQLRGFLMDWPTIKKQLEESCADILPEAQLLPLVDENIFERRLASLPVTLVPGNIPSEEPIEEGLSRRMWILALAWVATLMAFGASGFLLHGANSLSKRRSTFVSAVTHELRTPLTTFRMYTDLLLTGKLNEEKTDKYLHTLSHETDRLTHMVENVLAFSRLEKTSAKDMNEEFTAGSVLKRCEKNLLDRCQRDGMLLEINFPEALTDKKILGDPAAVEHILFNLVDNACKYASSAENKTLTLDFAETRNKLSLTLRDHGPGISQPQNLFKPFSKSVQAAAQSKPGIGLGLALCRQFAREMGGDLKYRPAENGGAQFILDLKLS